MASSSEQSTDAPYAEGAPPSDADMAQAFKDLASGEKAAQALEANLDSLEKKLDDMLASFEVAERERVSASTSSDKEGNSGNNGKGKELS